MNPIEKIKILLAIRQGKIGGGETYVLSLVEKIDKEKFEPVVLAFTEGPMIERLKTMGVKTYVVYTETPFDIRVWKKVKQIVRDENVHIVHAQGTRAMSNVFSAAKSDHLPLIYTNQGWSFHEGQNPIVKALRIQGEKYLTRQSSVNVCGAKANRTEARKEFGTFEAEIIYNSVDPQKFNPYGTYKNIRQELNIRKDEILISSVARFTLQKQPLQLIRAFAEVSKKVPKAKLLLVGDGELKDDITKLIQKLHLENRVIVQPFRQDVPDVLAAIDIFVLPSLWEGFSIALIEALSMGKTTVATNVNGTPEILQHNENGLLIEIDRLEENLTEAITTLCFNKELRSRLAQGAINSTYKKYDLETMVAKNESLYQRLAGCNNQQKSGAKTNHLEKVV